MDPIRIRFCENVDHFVEAAGQLPPTPPLMSEKKQRIFFITLIGGSVVFALARQYQQGADWKFIVLAVVFFLVVGAFWLWFFKKVGLYKTGPRTPYQWTEKDRARLQQSYLKQTGRIETNVVCEFNEQGFSLLPENDKPGSHEWAAMLKAVESPKGLLVFLRKSGYFWFPKRAFATDEAYQQVLDLARKGVPQFQKL